MRASTGKPTISIGLLAMLALAIVGPAVGDNANKSVKIGADLSLIHI